MKPSSLIQGNWLSQLLFTLSLVFLAFGLFNLAWFVWPNPTDAVQLTIPAGMLKGAQSGTTYASLADSNLSLSWPAWLRVEQEGALQVSLIAVEDADANTMVSRPAQVIVIEPNLFGLAVDPPGRMQASLAAGQSLDMSWAVVGRSRGEYPGKVLVSFGFYDQISRELNTVPVAVVDMDIRVVSLWDNQPQLALWLGSVGMVLWGALFVLGRLVQIR
jgi:hypothetical protein